MNVITGRLAQIIFAVPMIFFGVFHFLNAKGMAGMVPFPGGVYWVYFTGLCLIASAIAIISGRLANLAGFLLGLMIFGFAFILHFPKLIHAANQQEMMMPMISFLKDISIASGAWIISGINQK